jgi:hypothetical protein
MFFLRALARMIPDARAAWSRGDRRAIDPASAPRYQRETVKIVLQPPAVGRSISKNGSF